MVATVPENITLTLTGYRVRGQVQVTLWDGFRGYLDMNPTLLGVLDSAPTEDIVLACVNDGGYGVMSIDHASVTVFSVYDYEVERFVEDFTFTGDQLGSAKRGT